MAVRRPAPSGAVSGNAAGQGTSSRIRTLSHVLANQIAAGEVIERPASVVKELLENSLDAGARRIEIETESAGVGLVRVCDDGIGIHRDDLEMALRAHTTSKISSLSDLERIGSLGFRGEALPSIAAVSRLTLRSRLAGSAGCWEIACDGGVVDDQRPAAGPPGTLVSVRDLFFNTPARRKFLRTERTEFRHLEETVRRVALSRFEVAFSFRHGGREVLRLPAATGAQEGVRRVGRICGHAFTDHAAYVDIEGPGMRLHGWLGMPSAARGTTDLQYFFVNGRAVRDSTARHAVRQAYESRIPAGRHPAYVLYLDIEPSAVDVNVHPAKHEVRFREARLVHDFIWRNLARNFDGALIEPPDGGQESAGLSSPAAAPPQGFDALSDLSAEYQGSDQGSVRASRTPPTSHHPGAGGQAVSVIDNRYAVAVGGEKISLVDLAAARRVILAQALASAVDAGPAPSRPLLLPMVLDVRVSEADALETHGDAVEQLGFDLRHTAPGTVAAYAVPAALAHAPAGELVNVVIRWSGERGQPALPALCEALAAVGAAHLEDLLSGGEALQSFLRAVEPHADALSEARAWLSLDAGDLKQLLRRWRR